MCCGVALCIINTANDFPCRYSAREPAHPSPTAGKQGITSCSGRTPERHRAYHVKVPTTYDVPSQRIKNRPKRHQTIEKSGKTLNNKNVGF